MTATKPVVLGVLFFSTFLSYLVFINWAANEAPFIAFTSTLKSLKSFHSAYSRDEIETINSLLIDKPNSCNESVLRNVSLLVFVFSSPKNFAARQAIRQTWGKYAIEHGAKLLFIIGDSENSSVIDTIRHEDSDNRDIVLGSFIDSYSNLTLKTMTMVKWVAKNCKEVNYVLKTDDDMFLNVQKIIDFAQKKSNEKVFIGRVAKAWSPIRNPESKYFIPKDLYSERLYPDFVTGPCYLFTGDAAEPLISTALKMTPISLEDVFMTGIVAESANIKRINHNGIRNIHLRINSCTFRTLMASHHYPPNEIIHLWNHVHNTTCLT